MINSKLIFQLLVISAFFSPSLQAQNFENLLDELSGSEADQIESEVLDPNLEPPKFPSSTEMNAPHEDEDFAEEKNITTKGVTLKGLDKQTARVYFIDAPVGKTIEFGNLRILVHRCEKTPIEDREDSMAFLTISEERPQDEPKTIFSGWMFASSPALSCLDHTVYDIWVKECKDLKSKE